MTGIFLLSAVLIWLAIAAWLSNVFTKRLRPSIWRMPMATSVFAILLPLPLIDEFVASRQFKALCEANSSVVIDAPNPQGRTVWFGETVRTEIRLGAIQVTQARRNYVDAITQEPIYHYFRLEAKGGWLISHLGISEGGSPLLFPAVCQPDDLQTVDAHLGLTRINRPTFN